MAATKSTERRLEQVRRRLERWRQMRVYAHAPMPPRLWAVAVALTRQHGLYRTARALRVDYGALKRHVEAAAPAPRERPTFVEIAAAESRPREACTIEIDGPRTTLRLRVPDLPLSELATLGRLLAGLEP